MLLLLVAAAPGSDQATDIIIVTAEQPPVNLEASEQLSFRAELRRVGAAVDLDPESHKARLASGTEINLRARWKVGRFSQRMQLALTGSIDNLSEDLITPQLGLPLPGRSVRMGVRVN